jgi:hypothetical protein
MSDIILSGTIIPLLIIGILYLIVKKIDKVRDKNFELKQVKAKEIKEKAEKKKQKLINDAIKLKEEAAENLRKEKRERKLREADPIFIKNEKINKLKWVLLEDKYDHNEIRIMGKTDIGDEYFVADYLDFKLSEINKLIREKNYSLKKIVNLIENKDSRRDLLNQIPN